MKKCLGCGKELSKYQFISDDGLCGICNSINKHSISQKWNKNKKKWISKINKQKSML